MQEIYVQVNCEFYVFKLRNFLKDVFKNRSTFVCGMQPVCNGYATSMLPVCNGYATGMQPVCYRYATGMLPVCYLYDLTYPEVLPVTG